MEVHVEKPSGEGRSQTPAKSSLLQATRYGHKLYPRWSFPMGWGRKSGSGADLLYSISNLAERIAPWKVAGIVSLFGLLPCGAFHLVKLYQAGPRLLEG